MFFTLHYILNGQTVTVRFDNLREAYTAYSGLPYASAVSWAELRVSTTVVPLATFDRSVAIRQIGLSKK